MAWHVSHVDTGAIAFATNTFATAVRAARALADMEWPALKMIKGRGKPVRIKPLPVAWVVQSIRRVESLPDLWCTHGLYFLPAKEVADLYERML